MPAHRAATHAGSWYEANGTKLTAQLSSWLEKVEPKQAEGLPIPQLPVPGARVIIAPHAGYAYSGPAAAWAYACLDISPAKTKRIFLLGPSHHVYLTSCALPACETYDTPVGNLQIDSKLVAELQKKIKFQAMNLETDEDEHSLEMHLPYVRHLIGKSFGSTSTAPLLVPILVGSTSAETERQYGRVLAPYLQDESNLFIVSSDFCHWGQRFNYTLYFPTQLLQSDAKSMNGVDVGAAKPRTYNPPLHAGIENVDRACMKVIEGGSHEEWCKILAKTKNTVCGRHPIGILLAAIEAWRVTCHLSAHKGRFQFVRYERSSLVEDPDDSSVSYASAYAVL